MSTLAAPVPRDELLTTPPHDVPSLQSGDRLARVEFERRYDAMPTLKNAELIEGVVHSESSARKQEHKSCRHWP